METWTITYTHLNGEESNDFEANNMLDAIAQCIEDGIPIQSIIKAEYEDQ